MATFKFTLICLVLAGASPAFAQYRLPPPPVLPPINQGAPPPAIIVNPYRPLPNPTAPVQPLPQPPAGGQQITREICKPASNGGMICYRIP